MSDDKLLNPSEYMRGWRPELFTDSVVIEKQSLSRAELEYLIFSLTRRDQFYAFEGFARRLMQKKVCPNITEQTGPSSGGDRKVDAETYPVSEEIAERWFEGIGIGENAAHERWAFCFSAKADWDNKVREDVKKAVATGRGYKRIYFVTNQSARSKTTGEIEDDLERKLSEKHGVRVVIFDLQWTVDTILNEDLWPIVFEFLADEKPPTVINSVSIGPYDAERQRELDLLDKEIQDPEKYQHAKHQLAEDWLQSAILSCGLGHKAHLVEGRFATAESIAKQVGSNQLTARILYKSAWTAFFWFNDFAKLEQRYDELEPFLLSSDSVWDLDRLVNLFHCGVSWSLGDSPKLDRERWQQRTERIKSALEKHATRTDGVTAQLWARTRLLLVTLLVDPITDASKKRIFSELDAILGQIEGRIEFPLEPLAEIIKRLGDIFSNDDTYDKLSETLRKLISSRAGAIKEGLYLRDRGLQKLQHGKVYEAINSLAKAQFLLAKDEQLHRFIHALRCTAFAYESAGLLWASRGTLLIALNIQLSEDSKNVTLTPNAIPIFLKLAWIDLWLGRVPCVLGWLELVVLYVANLELSEKYKSRLDDEFKAIDQSLSILILRTRFHDLPHLERVPGLLKNWTFIFSRAALMVLLGHEQALKKEAGVPLDTDVDQFFSDGLVHSRALKLPELADWHVDDEISMRTTILGCDIELKTQNLTNSMILAEALLGFLESFLSTAMLLHGVHATRPALAIELRQSEFADKPFTMNVVEDDIGETKIVLAHPKESVIDLLDDENALEEFLMLFLSQVLDEVHISPFIVQALELLFSDHRAQDRALLAAGSAKAISNFLPNSKYQVSDWFIHVGNDDEVLPLVRAEQWKAKAPSQEALEAFKLHQKPVKSRRAENFRVDSLKHNEFKIGSITNSKLWDRANWTGVGFSLDENSGIPDLFLVFENSDAGRKIFRGWHKRFGPIDTREQISVSIITGIDSAHPAHYRVVIMPGEDLIKSIAPDDGPVIVVPRVQTMETSTTENLDRFLEIFEKSKRYQLREGTHVPGRSAPILKRAIQIVPAWEISPESILAPATVGIKAPIIPAEVNDPPILKTLARFNRPANSS